MIHRNEVSLRWLVPDWPASAWVHAATSTRQGGVSAPPFDGLNLSAAVGDAPEVVRRNRTLLFDALGLPAGPLWLRQVHGRRVVDIGHTPTDVAADAAVCGVRGRVCAVLTADCLPVLFCDRQGTRVGAAHAGWRGLAAGVLSAAVEALGGPGTDIMAWLGPAIGPSRFEVGGEVRDTFLARDPGNRTAFRTSRQGRWLADLYGLATNELSSLGVAVYGGGWCTYEDQGRFFSYRRQPRTGRMASLIWLAPSESCDSLSPTVA